MSSLREEAALLCPVEIRLGISARGSLTKTSGRTRLLSTVPGVTSSYLGLPTSSVSLVMLKVLPSSSGYPLCTRSICFESWLTNYSSESAI